jgi:hypothetical protein
VGTSPKQIVYERVPDRYALRLGRGPMPKGVLERFDPGFVIVAGEPPGNEPGALPVYRQPGASEVAVATGRVFVRLMEGLAAADRSGAFRRLGYDIERVLPYAGHAAWLRARRGGAVAALAGMRDLVSVEGVCHVEPELLRRRAPRSRGGR